MTHDEAALLLTDLLSRRLSPPVEQDVRTHLDGCSECTSLVATHEMLAGQHLPVEDLVDLVLNPEQIDKGRRRRLEAHVDVCPECSAEARQIRAAERDAKGGILGLGRTGDIGILPGAAAAAVLGLGLSAYLGLHRIPSLESTIDRLEARLLREPMTPRPEPEAQVGPFVRSQYVTAPRRGDAETSKVSIDAGQPYQYLSISAEHLEIKGECTVEVTTRRGDLLWSRTVPEADVRISMGPELTVAIPTKVLHPGRFVLRLGDSTMSKSGPLRELWFDVEAK